MGKKGCIPYSINPGERAKVEVGSSIDVDSSATSMEKQQSSVQTFLGADGRNTRQLLTFEIFQHRTTTRRNEADFISQA